MSRASGVGIPWPAPPIRNPRRVVVTGMGIVSPLGVGAQTTWQALLAGKCGVQALDGELARSPSRVAARVPRGTGEGQFSLERTVGRANMRTQGVDYIGMALAAAHEALRDALLLSSLDDGESAEQSGDGTPRERVSYYPPERFGVAIGSGVSNIAEVGSTAVTLADPAGVEAAQRRISPFFVPRVLNNMAAGHASIRWQLLGPNHAASTACATGAHAIGDAFRFIKYGDADAMLAGGTEACINLISLTGFSRAKALSTSFNASPAAASRPFDKLRDGFVLGEGAAVLVLEELEHARQRGATMYAEVRGYGLSGDGNHITAPREDGSGALRCMQAALAEGGLRAADVDYINAHATSTPLGDSVEITAIRRLLAGEGRSSASGGGGGRGSAPPVMVSSTKGAVGHLLGAAGSIEAAFSALAVSTGMLPPTLNLESLDHEAQAAEDAGECSFIRAAATAPRGVRAALSNSFGFGGTNATLLFTPAPPKAKMGGCG